MKVLSPAKVNLYLKVLGRREDGFHELESLMCAVNVGDELEFEVGGSGVELRVEGADLDAGPANLVWRAAEAVRERARTKMGVKIILRKVIPMGGGLGGGSSNAAMTLLAVNKLLKANLGVGVLNELAAGLGSDVNFFLQSKPAVCRGRGEKISPVALRNLPWVVLAHPGFGVSTPWAYKTYEQNPCEGKKGKKFDWGDPEKGVTLQNDLEPAIFSKYLWIQEAKAWLQSHPLVKDALMSGSGATVFAVVGNEREGKMLAEEAVERFGSHAWIRVAKLLSGASQK